jgi:hypothetical protein
MMSVIRNSLAAHFNAKLVDELLEAFDEAKRNYYEGGHRLSAVEGGRFCEASFRILEEATTGNFTPIGTVLDTERLERRLSALPAAAFSRSIRVYIPRALRVVYDIRNNRDTAHLADGIDPNIQDANLVIGILGWVMAELVRLYHGVTAKEAQRIVDELSVRRAPIIQEFGEVPRILRSDLRTSDYVLLLLYHVDSKGASLTNLSSWVRPSMRANLRRTLRGLDDKAFVHQSGEHSQITQLGKQYIEDNRLLQPLSREAVVYIMGRFIVDTPASLILTVTTLKAKMA